MGVEETLPVFAVFGKVAAEEGTATSDCLEQKFQESPGVTNRVTWGPRALGS